MKKSSGLFVLFIVVFTELIGFGLIIPVLPVLAKSFQLNYFSLGILMASFSLAQFFAAPILGYLSDKFGRKPILVLSKCGTVFAYLMLAYANTYWMFLVARLLDGFTGGNIAVARAYVCDVTEPKNRAKGMAVIGISFGLGFIIGPALGGLLYNGSDSQRMVSLVAASLSFLAVIVTLIFLKEPQRHESTIQESFFKRLFMLKNPMIIGLCSIYCAYMIVFSGFETTFSMFVDYLFGLTIKQISVLFMYAGLIGLVIHGVLIRRASEHYAIFTVIGFVLMCVGFFGMALSNSVIGLCCYLGIFSAGISLVNAFMPSLVSSYTTTKTRGLVMGVYEGIGSLSRVIGPILAYSISISLIRYEYVLYSIVIFFLSFVLYLKYLRQTPDLIKSKK